MEAVDTLWHVAFGVAYRILGAPWQAEDVAQITLEKWLALPPGTADKPASYIARIAANTALNTLRADDALARKHQKFGLPMPVSVQPLDAAEARIDLSYGVSALLLRLPAHMRAVFILRSAFDLSFDEIAQALDRSSEACRQGYSRARKRLTEHNSTPPAPLADKVQLERLISLIQNGQPDQLAKYLAQDVAFESDGGTSGPAFGQTIEGHARIAQFLVVSPVLLGDTLTADFGQSASGTYFTLHHRGILQLVGLAQISNAQITRIFAVTDREKLDKFAQQSRMSL